MPGFVRVLCFSAVPLNTAPKFYFHVRSGDLSRAVDAKILSWDGTES